MRIALVTLVALSTAVPASASDDALADARTAYHALDYDKCKAEALRAMKQPAEKPSRVESWQLLGLCQAALNATEEAQESFKTMLAIDKDARLPDGLSPRFTSSYREAKGALVGRTLLSLEVESDTVDGGTRTLRLRLTDALDLARDIAWKGEGGVLSPATRAAERLELEVPANVDVTLIVRDRGQGEIVLLALPKPGSEKPADPAVVAEEEGANLTPIFIVGGIVAGVLVLGGAATVLVVLMTPPDSVTLKTDVAFQK